VVRKQLDKQSNSLIDFIEDIVPSEFSAEQPTIEEEIDSRQKMERFTGSVAKLPRQCQRVFVLKKVYGYSHKEISAKLGISISTIEKQVSTGMKRCLDEMETQDMVLVQKNSKSKEQ